MSKNPSEVAVIYQSAEPKKIRLSLARNARPGATQLIKQENSDDFVAVAPYIKPEPVDSDAPGCSSANTTPVAREAASASNCTVPAATTSSDHASSAPDFIPAVNVKQELDNGTYSEPLSIPLGDPSTRRRQYKVSAVREKIRAKVRPEGEMDAAAKKFHERMVRMDLLLPIRFGRGRSLHQSNAEQDENERFSPSALQPQEIHEPPEHSRGRLNRYCDAIGPTMFDMYAKYIEEQEQFWNTGQEYGFISGEAQRRQQEGESSEDAAAIGTIPLPAGPMPRQAPPGLPDRVRTDVAIEPTRTGLSGAAAVRLMQRKKMHRCKVCKNRFVEKDIFERHLRDRHPDHYEKYKYEEETEEQRRLAAEEEIKRKLAEAEERRNERLAQQYEMLHAENERRAKKGLPELSFEQMFPPKIEQKWYIEGDGGGEERGKKSWPKRNCPQCPFCDRRYRDNLGLRRHIARKHPDCINFVQCNQCYKCVKNADELPNHDCESSWLCLECNPIRNMCTAERLQKHRSKFHRGEQSGFQCAECQRKFLTPRRLKQHQKLAHVHHKPYKCGFCMEYFESELAVALHERIHTGKIKYECNICDYKCNRWSRLTEHKQVDHGYLCMQCGDRMMEFEQLKYHTLAQHEGYLSAENQAMFLVSPRLWILYKGE